MNCLNNHRKVIAAQLRQLARDIEEVCHGSMVMSHARRAVSACTDSLCAEVRVIEANVESEQLRDEIAMLKLPKPRAKARKKR